MKSLIELEEERFEWSSEVFREATSISSLRKLEEEIKEIEESIMRKKADPVEYADALMCLLDSAAREGISLPEIIAAFRMKVEINKRRNWAKNPDNSYSHISDGLPLPG